MSQVRCSTTVENFLYSVGNNSIDTRCARSAAFKGRLPLGILHARVGSQPTRVGVLSQGNEWAESPLHKGVDLSIRATAAISFRNNPFACVCAGSQLQQPMRI